MASATEALARFIAKVTLDDVPGETLERAKLVFADTIGVIVASSAEPEIRRLSSSATNKGRSSLLNRNFQRTDIAAAAFINATAGSFLELDEGERPTGHPAIHVLPAALAVSEDRCARGSDLLLALIVGYEVQSRVQSACQLRWPVHPHGNLGQPAAITAIGKLRGWDAEQLARGINSAASLALATSWKSCLIGATTRNSYAGMSATVALTAAQLVEAGFSADPAALHETYGIVLGAGFDQAALTENLGTSFAVERGYFKFHSACALVHPVLDALSDALGVRPAHGSYPLWQLSDPAPREIQRVVVRVRSQALSLGRRQSFNQLSSKFSIPYAVAAYLVHGSSGPQTYRGAVLHDPEVAELCERVSLKWLPEADARWPQEAVAAVEIELEDGSRLSGSCANPYGSVDPPDTADLAAKFVALTSDVLGDELARQLWSEARAIDTCSDVSTWLPRLP